eukprot:1161043-Pelagomonas_calceolata.AAC.3
MPKKEAKAVQKSTGTLLSREHNSDARHTHIKDVCKVQFVNVQRGCRTESPSVNEHPMLTEKTYKTKD